MPVRPTPYGTPDGSTTATITGSIGRMTQPARSKTWIIVAAVGGAALVFLAALVFAVVYQWGTKTAPDGPPVTITSCDHRGDETRIGYKVTNEGTEARTWRLRFRVLDASGREISTDFDYSGKLEPGETDQNAVTLGHVGRVGASCEYLGEE